MVHQHKVERGRVARAFDLAGITNAVGERSDPPISPERRTLQRSGRGWPGHSPFSLIVANECSGRSMDIDPNSQISACFLLGFRSTSLLWGMKSILEPATRDSWDVLVDRSWKQETFS